MTADMLVEGEEAVHALCKLSNVHASANTAQRTACGP